jgi:SAM-dependent methyltransferase
MALSASHTAAAAGAVVWHDVECSRYTADLDVWRALARTAVPRPGSAPILDLGAGTGRLTLALARSGHRVTAVEADPELAGALSERVRGLPVVVIAADARELTLDTEPHALAIAAMQTVQLMGGRRGRRAFLASAARLLRPGGMLACALVEELEPYDASTGDEPPDAETLTRDGIRYESRALRVGRERWRTVIERERSITKAGTATLVHRHLDKLDLLTAAQLEREGADAGLRVLPREVVPATEEHIGSTVVVLGA